MFVVTPVEVGEPVAVDCKHSGEVFPNPDGVLESLYGGRAGSVFPVTFPLPAIRPQSSALRISPRGKLPAKCKGPEDARKSLWERGVLSRRGVGQAESGCTPQT